MTDQPRMVVSEGFGRRLEQAMIQRGVHTVLAFAKLGGGSRNTIKKWLASATPPPPATTIKFARTLGCAPSALDPEIVDPDLGRRVGRVRTPLIDERFHHAALRWEGVLDFCVAHWPISATEVDAHQLQGSRLDGALNNSRRWCVRGGARQWLLREILRKEVAVAERVAVKHDLMRFLHDRGFPLVLPERRREGELAFVGSRTTCFELYQYQDGVPYFSAEREASLSGLLIDLLSSSEALQRDRPVWLERLGSRLGPFHPFGAHQGLAGATRARIAQLTGSLRALPPDERDLITEVGDAVVRWLQREDEVRKELRSAPIRYLVHGDVTETNLFVESRTKRLFLHDWDTVRLSRGGPFDVAFAIVRLAAPALEPESHSLSPRDLERCCAFWATLDSTCPASVRPNRQTLTLALRMVAIEFARRMEEYFQYLAEDVALRPRIAYIRRCNPGRVDQVIAALGLEAADKLRMRGA